MTLLGTAEKEEPRERNRQGFERGKWRGTQGRDHLCTHLVWWTGEGSRMEDPLPDSPQPSPALLPRELDRILTLGSD